MDIMSMIGEENLKSLLTHKIENKMLEAKLMKNKLNQTQALSDMLSQYQEQQSQANRGAYQLSPGSEDPNIMNPEIQPVAQPSGQNLLNQFMQAYPEHAGTIMTNANDPKKKLEQLAVDFASGKGGEGGMGQLASKLNTGAGIEPVQGATLAAGGLNLAPFIQANTAAERLDLQKKDADTRTEFNIKTGQLEQFDVNKYTREEIPNTRKVTKDAEITWQEHDIAGVGKVKVPYKIVNGTPVQIPFGQGQKASGSREPAFDIAIPATPGIVAQRPEGQQQIQKTDFPAWINPKTGQHPNKTMTTTDLENQGFVPYQKLSATDEAVFPLAVNSLPELDKVKAWLFPKGELSIKNWAKFQAGVGEGAGMWGKLVQSVWAQLRKETGAAVTKEEAEAKTREYVYGLKGISDPKGIIDGLDRLGANLQGFIQQADPTGVHRKLLEIGRKPSLKMPQQKTTENKNQIGRFKVETE